MKHPATRRPLTPKHHLYAEGVLAGKSYKQAAIDAGYSAASASSRALELNNHPDVAKLIEDGKKRLAEQTGYTVERAMTELDTAINKASEAKQYNAVVKAIEAKARMVGILDKNDSPVQINVSGIYEPLRQARQRLADYRSEQRDAAVAQIVDAIDVTAARPAIVSTTEGAADGTR